MANTSVKVSLSGKFKKSFAKLPSRIQDKATQKMAVFEKNPFDPQLKTHKLKGELQNYWSYSINRSYRILFCFLNENKALYYDIGTHEIYR
jgi:addiction module RelE/StbE family toxin